MKFAPLLRQINLQHDCTSVLIQTSRAVGNISLMRMLQRNQEQIRRLRVLVSHNFGYQISKTIVTARVHSALVNANISDTRRPDQDQEDPERFEFQ